MNNDSAINAHVHSKKRRDSYTINKILYTKYMKSNKKQKNFMKLKIFLPKKSTLELSRMSLWEDST